MTLASERKPLLIIDDDPLSLAMLAHHVAASGHEPLTALSGARGLEILVERQPEIVILDWRMAVMDGLTVCRAVRGEHGQRYTYVIMLTVESDKDRLVDAFDAGVDDFLSKPFHPGELQARIRAGVRMTALYDELVQNASRFSKMNNELTTLNTRLVEAASTDELTGLLNRRQAIFRLQEHLSLARRYMEPFACTMLDVDHFKNINDLYGHIRGDQVLQTVARALGATARGTDTVYRLGGEEFMILLPRQNASQAIICAERCRTAVESLRFGFAPDFRVTISAGVTQYAPGMGEPDDVLRAADSALYEAKRLGRNRSIVATAAA
ncbi:MAG: diguanylate cyclase [Planctomycetaceae bacterium]|nr:diguanylate cyclase [Planctomycetaceae bacterium]